LLHREAEIASASDEAQCVDIVLRIDAIASTVALTARLKARKMKTRPRARSKIVLLNIYFAFFLVFNDDILHIVL